MKLAVSAILTFNHQIFYIKRQNFLKAFPGFIAFPGGKVDEDEHSTPIAGLDLEEIEHKLIHCLQRELKEELNFDFFKELEENNILNVTFLGNAITPKFNYHRFNTYFFKIDLTYKPQLTIDTGEFAYGKWSHPKEIMNRFLESCYLAVPPTITLIKALLNDMNFQRPLDLTPDFDIHKDVPCVEFISGVQQYLPLSNTLPPANRTNCFLIGDEKKILIDPSPACENELKKLNYALSSHKIQGIFLTHHHQDHHEFSSHIAKMRNIPMIMGKTTCQLIKKNFDTDYFDNIKLLFVKEGDILTQSKGVAGL
jgi:8-oxo-dGTP pyrophosphatase MutT (NUDIX family)